jgi:hypothetical protein
MSTRIALMTALLATIALFWVAFTGAPAAFASFTSKPGAALPIGTATIHAPGAVTASVSCASPATLTASWTASTGATPAGYSVSVIKNGFGPTQAKTVSGTTTSTSLNISGLTLYVVVIQAQYGSWTSATSPQSNTVFCL